VRATVVYAEADLKGLIKWRPDVGHFGIYYF